MAHEYSSLRGLALLSALYFSLREVGAASWTLDAFKNMDGSPFGGIDGPTVIKQGPDLRFYVGSKGFVTALTLDDDYRVTDVCTSQSFGWDRTVLGMAFEPRKFEEGDIYFYIATSTLNWGGGQNGDPESIPGGWKNGMVQVMRSNSNGHCLSVTRNLVTGLSVSNHDHGVNGMEVGLNGKLYVINGGMTNAGHSEKGDGDGGSPATPLSAALLEVNYNIENFNGDVLYDSDDGRVANIIGDPDVKVYASGFMNAFSIELHTNKEMYMVDNGPNPGYGKESTSCTTNLETEPHYPDKFLRVRKKAWYGHPNRNRGRFDPKQCTFQHIGKNAPGQERHLETIEASTNGMTEYSSYKLGPDFKGAMCFARIGFGEPGNSFALFLNRRGNRVQSREEIMEEGGLDMIMDRHGNLVVTDYMNSRIKVLRAVPEGEAATSYVAVYSVLPRRGPPEGGNKIWITGRFPQEGGIAVFVGSRMCGDVVYYNTNTISCQVPRGNPASSVRVQVEINGIYSPTFGQADYTYMKRKTNGGLVPHML